jgi:2-hydroxy-6-oxonona-2,4-dienedioate hydrolase
MSIWIDLATAPFELAFVDVDGSRIRSLQLGEGEPLILLHGTSSHLEVFARNVRAYAEAGYRVHAIDMLGHGYSDKPMRDLEVADYVENLRRYIDVQQLGRVHLLGESLGGWVAAWFASEHPEYVRSLQLVSSGGTRAVPEIMRRIESTTLAAAEETDRGATYERLVKLFEDPAQLSDELVDVRYAIYHQPEFRAMLPHLLCMQRMDVRQRNLLRPDRMGRIAAPTRIFWGRHNPMGDVSEADGINDAIPGSTLHVFEQCGHFPQLEFPDEFNALSIEFLAGVRG